MTKAFSKVFAIVVLGTSLTGCAQMMTAGENMKADATSALIGPRELVQGNYFHDYFNMHGDKIGRDAFTYEAIGTTRRKPTDVGYCFYPTEITTPGRKINGYPVRDGFVKGECNYPDFWDPKDVLGKYPSPQR